MRFIIQKFTQREIISDLKKSDSTKKKVEMIKFLPNL